MSPHLDKAETRAVLTRIETAEGDERRALKAQLAWRPAWAIRSRSGALRVFLAWLRGTENRP